MKKSMLLFCLLILGPMSYAADDVRLLLSTSEGEIEIDLYLQRAPVTAGNFL